MYSASETLRIAKAYSQLGIAERSIIEGLIENDWHSSMVKFSVQYVNPDKKNATNTIKKIKKLESMGLLVLTRGKQYSMRDELTGSRVEKIALVGNWMDVLLNMEVE